MAEVLVRFDDPIVALDGQRYHAQVCGRVAGDGLWEGWVEFEPADGSAWMRSPRETEQANKTDLAYWATGLTRTYLQGALERARRAASGDAAADRPVALSLPAFDTPAASIPPRTAPRMRAVLDPFAVYAQGEAVLKQQLGALSRDQLRDVITAHGLADVSTETPTTSAALVDAVVEAVRREVVPRPHP